MFKRVGTIINHPFWGTPIFGNIHLELWLLRYFFFLNAQPLLFGALVHVGVLD